MEYLKDKANQVSETVQGKGSEASAEGNKREPTTESSTLRYTDDVSRGCQG